MDTFYVVFQKIRLYTFPSVPVASGQHSEQTGVVFHQEGGSGRGQFFPVAIAEKHTDGINAHLCRSEHIVFAVANHHDAAFVVNLQCGNGMADDIGFRMKDAFFSPFLPQTRNNLPT